VHIGPFLLGL